MTVINLAIIRSSLLHSLLRRLRIVKRPALICFAFVGAGTGCCIRDCSYDATLKGDGQHLICGTEVGSTCTVSEGRFTTVALDDEDCQLLAHLESHHHGEIQLGGQNGPAFMKAADEGSIVQLSAKTKVRYVTGKLLKYGQFIPLNAVDPTKISGHKPLEVTTVHVQEGSLKDKFVCLPSSSLWPRYGPFP